MFSFKNRLIGFCLIRKGKQSIKFLEKSRLLEEINTFCRGRFWKKSKAIGLEKSSNFLENVFF